MKINYPDEYYEQGIKLNGKKLFEFRPIEIIQNISSTSEGSVMVKMGESEILSGVKMELTEPYADTPDKGNLMIDAHLVPLASEDFDFGPPSIRSIELSRVTDRAIRESECIDNSALVLKKGEKVWGVIVDIVPVNVDGDLFDIFSIGAISALLNAKFPKVVDNVIDYHALSNDHLPIEQIPITITTYKYKNYLFIDPSNEDLKYTEARLSVTTINNDTIVAFQKGGIGVFTKEEVKKAVEISFEKGAEIRKIIKDVFNYKK